MVSNPNKKGDEVKKEPSLSSSLLGFFYNHTKMILSFYLAVVVIVAFSFDFIRELAVYEQIRFTMNPMEIMYISISYSIFDIVKYFVPVFLIVSIIKYIMVKVRKAKLAYLFKKSLRRQMTISFILSLCFSIIFYMDVLSVTSYSRQLIESSIELFILFFLSILFILLSMYGLVKGVSPILKAKK